MTSTQDRAPLPPCRSARGAAARHLGLPPLHLADLLRRPCRYGHRPRPRLPCLATAIAENLLTHRDLMEAHARVLDSPETIDRFQIVNTHLDDRMPTMARLTSQIEERLRQAGLDSPAR